MGVLKCQLYSCSKVRLTLSVTFGPFLLVSLALAKAVYTQKIKKTK